MSRGGDAAHVLHLGGISKHLTRVLIVRDAGKAVHLRAANAVVRGHCHEKGGGEGCLQSWIQSDVRYNTILHAS